MQAKVKSWLSVKIGDLFGSKNSDPLKFDDKICSGQNRRNYAIPIELNHGL